ncbi:hypothetical protein EGR_05398 [Echinococcus granulosus]|uniref:Uncharacterized protein n=1 Tax=Echinococcus granulosus TaxID=6210 RepID=W6UF96_ECHGR|nr:hypothetical protein EGR_05398 [Echinococcus granulosus]EUB59778.1 hypothetical protein EGR_05398 [Echinococcus granulosus]
MPDTSNSPIPLAEATNGRAALYHMANQNGVEDKAEEKGEEAEVEAMEAVEEEAKKNRRNRSIWCHCALGCIPVKCTTYLLVLCMTSKTLESVFVPVRGVKPPKNGHIGYNVQVFQALLIALIGPLAAVRRELLSQARFSPLPKLFTSL